MPARQMDAVIIGAGVTGLAIALELTNRGHQVGIVAKDLPEDSESVGFASPWAGCNWCSFADNDKREQEWDRKTYKALFQVAKEHPELCELISFYSYEKASSPEPWFREIVRDYSVVDQPSSSSSPDQRLISYKSFIIHAPRYLCHLANILRSKGVQIIRKRLNSVQEAYTLPEFGQTFVVINATGLGARSILGSSSSSSSEGGERKNKAEEVIYPIRGQTVLVHAPGVKTCYMKTQDHPDASTTKDTEIPEPVYIIPRPGKEEHVVLGGSFQVNNWEYTPDFKLAERILQRTYELCPALAGPNGKSWRDIKIVSHNVGFRPGRAGGARLDLEELDIADPVHLAPASSSSKEGKKNGKVACIQAYGIGPAGYQASVGYAHEAADMCEQWLAKNKSAQAKL